METNAEGMVAIKYYQPIPRTLVFGDTTYNFAVRGYISMAWVKPEHVQRVTSIIKESCNCGGKGIFRLANRMDINLWEGKSARDESSIYA